MKKRKVNRILLVVSLVILIFALLVVAYKFDLLNLTGKITGQAVSGGRVCNAGNYADSSNVCSYQIETDDSLSNMGICKPETLKLIDRSKCPNTIGFGDTVQDDMNDIKVNIKPSSSTRVCFDSSGSESAAPEAVRISWKGVSCGTLGNQGSSAPKSVCCDISAGGDNCNNWCIDEADILAQSENVPFFSGEIGGVCFSRNQDVNALMNAALFLTWIYKDVAKHGQACDGTCVCKVKDDFCTLGCRRNSAKHGYSDISKVSGECVTKPPYSKVADAIAAIRKSGSDAWYQPHWRDEKIDWLANKYCSNVNNGVVAGCVCVYNDDFCRIGCRNAAKNHGISSEDIKLKLNWGCYPDANNKVKNLTAEGYTAWRQYNAIKAWDYLADYDCGGNGNYLDVNNKKGCVCSTKYCTDEDRDGYGEGPGCKGADCADSKSVDYRENKDFCLDRGKENIDCYKVDANGKRVNSGCAFCIHPGAEEVCYDNIDNNCNQDGVNVFDADSLTGADCADSGTASHYDSECYCKRCDLNDATKECVKDCIGDACGQLWCEKAVTPVYYSILQDETGVGECKACEGSKSWESGYYFEGWSTNQVPLDKVKGKMASTMTKIIKLSVNHDSTNKFYKIDLNVKFDNPTTDDAFKATGGGDSIGEDAIDLGRTGVLIDTWIGLKNEGMISEEYFNNKDNFWRYMRLFCEPGVFLNNLHGCKTRWLGEKLENGKFTEGKNIDIPYDFTMIMDYKRNEKNKGILTITGPKRSITIEIPNLQFKLAQPGFISKQFSTRPTYVGGGAPELQRPIMDFPTFKNTRTKGTEGVIENKPTGIGQYIYKNGYFKNPTAIGWAQDYKNWAFIGMDLEDEKIKPDPQKVETEFRNIINTCEGVVTPFSQ